MKVKKKRLTSSQITPTPSSTLSFKEYYYSNHSSEFWVYPGNTNSNTCSYYIPIQIISTSYQILNINYISGLAKRYGTGDGKEVLLVFGLNIPTGDVPFSFTFSENDIVYTYSFKVNCIAIDYSKLKYEIINSGLYYNSLAFTVKFDLFPPSYDLIIPFAFGSFAKTYMGNNQYFIEFQNHESFFKPDSNGNITISFLCYQNSIYNITIKSPFISTEESPIVSQSTGFKEDSNYLVISNLTTLNNYFIGNGDLNTYTLEPYLISSQNNIYRYLKSSALPISYPIYYLYLYKSSGLELISSVLNSYIGTPYPAMINTFFSSNQYSTLFSFSYNITNVPYIAQISLTPNVKFRYPYGVIGGDYSNPQYSFAFVSEPVVKAATIFYLSMNGASYLVSIAQNDNTGGTISSITDYFLELYPNGKMRISFAIDTPSILQSIIIYDTANTIYEVYSLNQIKTLNTTFPFQIVMPRISIYKIVTKTNQELLNPYVLYLPLNYLYKIGGKYQNIPTVQSIDKIQLSGFDYLTGLKKVLFLFNDLVVTNKGVSNKMFISLDSYPTDREVKVSFIYSDYRANEKKDIIYSTYNPTTSQFEFEFNIPKNIKPGNVSYTITLDSLDNINYYSYSLPLEYQLRVSESNNVDFFGPTVTDISIFQLSDQNKIIYKIELTDSANGFKQGYILVRGSIDMTERRITVSPSNLYAGTIFKGGYYLELTYDDPCLLQTFTIVYAYFEDTEGYSTEYDVMKLSTKSMFYLYGPNNILSIAIDCPNPVADSSNDPDLVELHFPTMQILGPKEESRIITFNYTAYHQNGISITYLPTLYLLNRNNLVWESFSTSVLASNSTHTSFSSKVKIQFFVAGPPRIAIYGVVSKSGTNGGFTPSTIASKGLKCDIGYSSNNSPIILSSSKLSSTGLGGLWLYGLYFDKASFYQIQYTDEENGGVFKNILPTSSTPHTIYFSSIKATNKPINIIIGYDSSYYSDPYNISPVVYNFAPSPTNSNNNTSLCKGSPLCGGPSQGTCTSSGCQCISPWTGIDCMSKVIQVTQPEINQTNPSTNITTGEEATINSIISIIGIKELSVNSNEVNKYSFEEWEYKLILNDSYVTRYTYSSYIKKNNIKVSNITVTLDWYKVESTIQFANEELHINPSSIKYTIQISSYPFTSQLNTLQLIMKASIQTTNSESCSDKQFGESIQEDADYIKLQIDKYSIYGRFIKRCQIDNSKIIKLTNTLLDSQMNDIDTINNSSQSYIGINIPQFSDNVIIDPDFSVILDSNSAKTNCKRTNSSLTTSQLAGIIVGSAAFFIVLVIIASTIIYKSPVKSQDEVTFQELLYNNNTLDFNGYPISSGLTKCQFKIPFSITSSDGILDVTSLIGSVTRTHINDDRLYYIGTLSATIAQSSQVVQFNIVRVSKTSAISITLHCLPFESSIEFTIINTGIHYNNLGMLIQSKNLPYPNVTLDFNVGALVKQYYIGSSLYFISLQYNYEMLFSSNNLKEVTIPISFSGFSRQLTFSSPFPTSDYEPPTISIKSFPINNNKISKYSAFLQLDNYNSSNNYFYSKNSQSEYSDEPFIISSNNNKNYTYLVPLYAGAPSTFLISNYYKNNRNLIFTQTFNQSDILLELPYVTAPQEFPNYLEVGIVISENIFPTIIEFQDYSTPLLFRYPFGCSGGNYDNSYYSFPISILENRKSIGKITTVISGHSFDIPISKTDSTEPQLNDPVISGYSLEFIPNFKMLLYLKFSSDNVDSISIYDSPTKIYKTYQFSEVKIRSVGLSLGCQIVLPRFNLNKIQIITKDQYFIDYILDQFYLYKLDSNIASLTSVQDLNKINGFDYLTCLKNVTFLFNDLVVTNKGVSNKMFISFDSYFTYRDVKVSFIYSDYRANEKKDIVYSTYNPTTSQFEFEFNIPKNIKPGNVSYTITLDSLDNINYYSYSLPLEYQLRVSESLNVDLFGPVVTDLKPISYSNQIKIKAGYTIEITDSANGFKQGHIIVRGSVDMTERNITITPSNLYAGTVLKGAYLVEFEYDFKCNIQVYTIVYAYFEDTEGYSTEYDVLKPNKKNPFYLILDSFNPSFTANCDSLPTTDGGSFNPDIVELSAPSISSIIFTNKEESRTLTFNYTAYHQDGILSTYLPTLYLTGKNIQIFKSFSTVILASNSTHSQFSSKIVLPFIETTEYFLSVYGVVSRAGTNIGFTASSFKSRNLPSSFKFSVSIYLPIITSSSILSSTGLGGLYLYGLYLDLPNIQFQIQYTEFDEIDIVVPYYIFSTSVFIKTIRATTKPINIIIVASGNTTSDPYKISPVIYDFNPSNVTPSPTNSNSPSLCKGSPLCGGPSQGTCISSGCQCISPWTGIDCMSKVIQVTQPEINQTNPSTNITTGEEATINSIISIIGIKELSVNSNEVNKYSFEEWEYKLILNDSYVTRYTYSSYIKKNNIKVSNITVTLDWYKVESTIQFANEELHINPSSIKYTIQISSYPFTSQLNTLQLIMKASIQTTNSESCLDKQFGESIQEDADYIKLQIDKYSIYGRFIKRCQIDNSKITKLTNTLLDSQMNDTITNDNYQTSRSYIGINIPQFSDNVIIDPDFSVILDSNSAKTNCKRTNSGLTTSQLAGIIVGSVAFFIVLVIIAATIIYKSPGCLNTKIFIYKIFKKSKL